MVLQQSKRFLFTWNNYGTDTLPFLKAFHETHCQYLIAGKEVGAQGTPHLQGYLTLKNKKTVKGLIKLGLKGCHITIASGDSSSNSTYCKKDNDFVEFGVLPFPGKRTDLESAIADIKEGVSMRDIADRHSAVFVKFGRGLRDLKLTLEVPYNHDSTRGLWIYGPPGTGKSHSARNIAPTAFLKPQSKWWDGYNGQHTVILDDLDTNVLGHYLKIWSDKYACTGETKGGTIHLHHQLFIVTSNYSPNELWRDDAHMLAAVERRFNIIHKTEKKQLLDHLKFELV